jgi:hypothetical protein
MFISSAYRHKEGGRIPCIRFSPFQLPDCPLISQERRLLFDEGKVHEFGSQKQFEDIDVEMLLLLENLTLVQDIFISKVMTPRLFTTRPIANGQYTAARLQGRILVLGCDQWRLVVRLWEQN